MTPTLSTLIASVRAADAAATAGPWESVDPGPLRDCRRIFASPSRYIGTIDNSDGHDTHEPDASFIALSRTTLPLFADLIEIQASAIADAPHSPECEFVLFQTDVTWWPGPCTCWKSRAALAVQTRLAQQL